MALPEPINPSPPRSVVGLVLGSTALLDPLQPMPRSAVKVDSAMALPDPIQVPDLRVLSGATIRAGAARGDEQECCEGQGVRDTCMGLLLTGEERKNRRG
jgi:hypothetical protein